MIGNDIVDFQFDENKYLNQRLIQRILTPQEQQHLSKASQPNGYLSSLWAAKEAAFKAVQRVDPTLTFSPVAFALSDAALSNLHHNHNHFLSADITFKHHSLTLRFEWPDKTVVHCLACLNPHKWPHIDSLIERQANLKNYQHQSQAVRAMAQSLLKKHHINAEIIRPDQAMPGYVKPGAPILVHPVTGHTLPHIISLSHDHQYLAAALYYG